MEKVPHIWILDMDGWMPDGEAVLARDRAEAVSVVMEHYDEDDGISPEWVKNLLHIARKLEILCDVESKAVLVDGYEVTPSGASVAVEGDELAAAMWEKRAEPRRVMLYAFDLSVTDNPTEGRAL